MNLAAGNRWIQMSHNATTDTITFKHYVKKFTEGTASTDLDNSATFTVQELAWDNAGHLTGSTKRTYTLQDGYKNVAVANSGANTTTVAPSATAGTLTAANRVDTVTMDTGNRWVVLTADATGKKMTISHAAPGTASTSKGDTAAQTPKFGATFKVLSAGIDQAGHVKSLADHTVKIPLPSLTDGDTGNVVTGLSLVAEDGAFTLARKNVGTLALTEYEGPSTNITSTIGSDDTINGAFSKVQSYLNSLTTRIDDLDFNSVGGGGYYISAIGQTDGKISATATAISTSISNTSTDTALVSPKAVYNYVTNAINNLDVTSKGGNTYYLSAISQTDGKISATAQSIATSISSASTDTSLASAKATFTLVDTAIKALDVDAVSAEAGQIIHKISQTDGKISAEVRDLTSDDIPDLSATYVASTHQFDYDLDQVETYETELSELTEAKMTIEQLMKKVATLEARIASLEA